MPQSLSSILIHLIFSTKNREPFITTEIETQLYPYLASIFAAQKFPALIINGTADHLHTLLTLSRVVSIADLVEEVKTSSSKWIKRKGSEFKNFHWQNGYGAFSIGRSQVPSVKSTLPDRKNITGRSVFKMSIGRSSSATRWNMTNGTFGTNPTAAWCGSRPRSRREEARSDKRTASSHRRVMIEFRAEAAE